MLMWTGAVFETSLVWRLHLVTRVHSRNLFLVGFPPRHDNPSLNRTVYEMNKRLQNTSFKLDNVKYLSLDSIPRSSFIRHGLHLNSRVNSRPILANLFLQSLEPGYVILPGPDSSKGSLNCRPDFSTFEKSSKTSQRPSKPLIRILPISSKIKSKRVQESCSFFGKSFLGEAERPPGAF